MNAPHVLRGCGIGLRKQHHDEVLATRPNVPWFELVTENYMADGGRPRAVLEAVRRDYPVALHGVSLSLGSAEPLDRRHLARLVDLVRRVEPAIVSDHLCWTSLGGHNSHDLLPLPFTEEAVRVAAARIRQVQDALGRRILVENVSSYVRLRTPSPALSEPEFVAAVLEEADCDLLLDVNNVYVSARNHGFEPADYLRRLPADRVKQMHLAGHDDGGSTVVDTHDRPVADAVWDLFRGAIELFGPVPALLEWDARIPDLSVLIGEALRATSLLEAHHPDAASWRTSLLPPPPPPIVVSHADAR